MNGDGTFTIGVEEEYLIVERGTRDLIREAPPTLLSGCKEILGDQVTPEFMQCQLEVGTRVCSSIQEVRDELTHLRRTVALVAEQHDLAMMCASTHPFATWQTQQQTPTERYRILARDLQKVARRLIISGMHVHVGIPDDHMRIEMMGQSAYFLPHLLALSTSSPFYGGHKTGLMSYRLSVWDGMPRSGLPEPFDSWVEYQRHLDMMVNAGLIEDASKIWWDIRPNARYPTLELRITDVCTQLDDAVTLAAIYVCWLHMLYRLRRANQRWRRYARMLINENRWLAQRYGFEAGLVDFARGELVPYEELLEEIIESLRPDAIELGCLEEVEQARNILRRGTSAHWQLETFDKARAEGASEREALERVVELLVERSRPEAGRDLVPQQRHLSVVSG